MTADFYSDPGKKLKIGILIRDPAKLDNWEYRILKGIVEHPNLQLTLLIKDGREQKYSIESRIKNNFFTNNSFLNLLWTIQVKIESRLFPGKKTVKSGEITEKIKNIEILCLNPVREGFFDVFSDEDSDKVKSYGLDIILRHEFCTIRGNILEAARYGIWSFNYIDIAINGGGPAGFWELVNNEPCCRMDLLKLTPGPDKECIIDKAWYNIHWTFFKNNNDLLESSVALLFKSIAGLLKRTNFETGVSPIQEKRAARKPALKYMLIYIFKFYSRLFMHIFNKMFRLKRQDCWTLFFGKGNFLDCDPAKLNPAPMPKGVFWADPFLYEHENQLYVFFETLVYKTMKGKISAGKVIEDGKGNFKVIDVKDILDFNYHMSYPQIFKEEGEIFLIPETFENKRLSIYRCLDFPDKWELYSTAFEGEEIVDTTYFCDENGDKWLFLNKGWTFESELYIYKIDSLKLENIIAHDFNPVFIDCRKARSGGAIFKNGKDYYRPGQINTDGVYGRGLQINKIKKLTLDEFEDEPIATIGYNFRKGLIGTHHLHQYGNNFVFDACYQKY